jgi:hypothetical protein
LLPFSPHPLDTSDDGAPEPAAPVDDGVYYYYPAGEYYYKESTDDQE